MHTLLTDFAAEIAGVRVLDPACGSGNFLYVALRELLNLQKAVISWAARRELPSIPLTVGPEQLYGIEINPYAHELAQITAWIGTLQWRNENGFANITDPILRPLHNIQRMDAILAYDANGNPVEPEWPVADVIIGNPPFLGGQRLLREFGEAYVQNMRDVYEQRLPHGSDLVTYWFEKARAQINKNFSGRVGFIATQAIRTGSNRMVLDRILDTGSVFFAWSDREWVLDGANVRVSIIGFDNGTQQTKFLNGSTVLKIHSNLTHGIDITTSIRLKENFDLSFKGIDKSGSFELSKTEASQLLEIQNQDPTFLNDTVVRPWINGLDITNRFREMWIIDFN